MKITGTWARRFSVLSWRQVSKPSRPGITASMTINCGMTAVGGDGHQILLLEGACEHADLIAGVVDQKDHIAVAGIFRHRIHRVCCRSLLSFLFPAAGEKLRRHRRTFINPFDIQKRLDTFQELHVIERLDEIVVVQNGAGTRAGEFVRALICARVDGSSLR